MYFSSDVLFYVSLNEALPKNGWNKLVYVLQEGAMWKFGTCWKVDRSLFLLRIITKQLRVHVWVL